MYINFNFLYPFPKQKMASNTADLDFSDLTGEDHGISGSHDQDGASSQSEGMCTPLFLDSVGKHSNFNL